MFHPQSFMIQNLNPFFAILEICEILSTPEDLLGTVTAKSRELTVEPYYLELSRVLKTVIKIN